MATRRNRALVAELLASTPELTKDEVAVALELFDASVDGDETYRLSFDFDGDDLRGYACYGPTPLTRATWDLYWIVVAQKHRRGGVGKRLIAEVEREIAAARGHLVRVETESSEPYAATRAFYDALGYERLATIRDFYDEGRDLVLYGKYFTDNRR